MNTAKHISEDDLALFALALMPPEEAAFTAAHLKYCDLCRGELARMQGDLVTYAMTAEMHSPPASARTRLLEAVAREKKSLSPAPAAEPVLSAGSRDFERGHRVAETPTRAVGWFGWLGWAAAAGLAVAAGLQLQTANHLRERVGAEDVALQTALGAPKVTPEMVRAQEVLRTLTDPRAMQVALQLPAKPGAAPKPEGHATYVESKGNLVFIASHLNPIERGKTYELWLLPASGRNAIPAGLFRPDENGNASVVLPRVPRHIAAKGFGVTLEDAGGAAKPTPPILLAGTAG